MGECKGAGEVARDTDQEGWAEGTNLKTATRSGAPKCQVASGSPGAAPGVSEDRRALSMIRKVMQPLRNTGLPGKSNQESQGPLTFPSLIRRLHWKKYQ